VSALRYQIAVDPGDGIGLVRALRAPAARLGFEAEVEAGPHAVPFGSKRWEHGTTGRADPPA
jgi:hypothetical protein